MEWYYGHAWGQSKDEENEDLSILRAYTLRVCMFAILC